MLQVFNNNCNLTRNQRSFLKTMQMVQTRLVSPLSPLGSWSSWGSSVIGSSLGFNHWVLFRCFSDKVLFRILNDWFLCEFSMIAFLLGYQCFFWACIYFVLSKRATTYVCVKNRCSVLHYIFKKEITLKGTVMQTENTLINDRLHISKVYCKFDIPNVYNLQ